MRTRFSLALTLSLSVLTDGASAQSQVLVVSPTGPYTQLQAAVDAASDGDIVLVKAGTYGALSIGDESVSIVADTAAAVSTGAISITDLSASHRVVLSGLQKNGWSGGVQRLALTNSAGAVRIDRSRIVGADGQTVSAAAGADVQQSTNVAFSNCVLVGGRLGALNGGPGVYASSSSVAFYDCDVTGGWGGSDYYTSYAGGDGGAGCHAAASFLFSSGSYFEGGWGGDAYASWGHKGVGGCGVLLSGVLNEMPALASMFAGGLGGCAPYAGCLGLSPDVCGFPGSLQVLSGGSKQLDVASPVRELSSAQVTIKAAPGDRVFLYTSVEPDWTWMSAWSGVSCTERPPSNGRAFLGIVPGSGTLTTDLPIPDLLPAGTGATLFLQLLAWDGSNTVTLGSPRTLVILDQSL
ncbi:MAG: hypothetical protein L6Q99_09870 [Planctomycetes bacterium]|nr:hypothetical protein [Planctomycetota bacterium]